MAPHETDWEALIQHVKFWRNEVKRSQGEAISRLALLSDFDGHPTLLGLATAPGDSATSQMVMQAQIPMDSPLPVDEKEERPIIELKPLVDVPQLLQTAAGDEQQKPSPELALHYERMRGQIVSGVTAYSVHAPTGAILLSTATQLMIYKHKDLKTIAHWLPPQASVLNASFCSTNPEFVAFNSSNQLYVDRNNTRAFASESSSLNVTNGVASFVTQEEFERYEGYWWCPVRVELLYERVDESSVNQLQFTLPGAQADEQPMRYPLAGTPNATSEPRICSLEEQSGQFVDLQLDAKLNEIVPWMEYMVRMGWTQDGNEIYILAMNRLQNQMAILLIPRTLFVPANRTGTGTGQIRTIYQETSPHWINANNLLHFLPPKSAEDGEKTQQQFILGSERSDKCHLYLQTHDSVNGAHSQPITRGEDWVLLKEAILKVDLNRGNVFYLANRISPLILSLCVSDLKCNDGLAKILTPTDLSFKFERSDPTIHLNPDVGFVCWLSAVDRLPECRFYRLVYVAGETLPTAVYTHRVGVQVITPTPGLGTTSGWGLPQLHRTPSSIFSHRFVQFQSQNSGQQHFGIMLWPAGAEEGQKFPVIQVVYAGPSIQIVRNSWHAISQCLKFIAYGYAVVMVDGRGSSNRGVQFEANIKERLGSVEVQDQLEGLQVLAEQSNGILDLDRVCVIGWSYGGYMALQLLAEFPKAYKAACAGGAVTEWQLYDTAYTERYMGLPQDNADAYTESAILSKIAKFPNQEGRLLIVHGMIDENVHFQHTVKLINALVAAQKPHRLLLFPNERHAIRSGESIEHFHASILSFFGDALLRNQ